MALDSHWKYVYEDVVKDLAGFLKRSLLKEFVDRDTKRGEVALFDTIAPADTADLTTMTTDTNYRADFDTIVNPVLADWLAIQTPHKNVALDKVLLSAKENLWAHWFRKKDEIAENANTESNKLRMGMKQMAVNQDAQIFSALSAPTQLRGKDPASAVAVAMPASQQLNIPGGTFDLDVISSIMEIFENNYNGDDEIYCAISPKAKKSLIDNSGGTIHSTDFVDNHDYFKMGKAPEIYGVKLICHPMVTSYSGASADAFFAWTKSAIMYNESDSLEVQIEEVPQQKFETVLMLREFIGTARCDDLGVVQGTLA